jgi:hypothetical protein
MKKFNTWTSLAIILAVMLYATVAFGQKDSETRYLLSGNEISISGFGGPIISFSQIENDFALLTGGGGAVLFNQSFFIGGFGEGVSTKHRLAEITVINKSGNPTTYYDLVTNFGYGGFWLGYVYKPKKAVHLGLSTRIGWGNVSLIEDDYHIDWHDNIMNDAVFVITPQAEIELNLYRWFKLNAGLGYRLVTGVDKTYLDQDGTRRNYFKKSGFSKPQLTIGLLFGGFGY